MICSVSTSLSFNELFQFKLCCDCYHHIDNNEKRKQEAALQAIGGPQSCRRCLLVIGNSPGSKIGLTALPNGLSSSLACCIQVHRNISIPSFMQRSLLYSSCLAAGALLMRSLVKNKHVLFWCVIRVTI